MCQCVEVAGGGGVCPHTHGITLPLHYHQSACISLFVCLPINLSDCLSLALIDQQPGGRDGGLLSALQEYRMSDMGGAETNILSTANCMRLHRAAS